jgi:hypothetical protein
MDVKPAAFATSKELINQLFISLLEERAFYARAGTDAIKVRRTLILDLKINCHNTNKTSLPLYARRLIGCSGRRTG